MYIVILYISIALAQQATKVTKPTLLQYNEVIDFSLFNSTQGKILQLKYNAYPGTFSMSLDNNETQDSSNQETFNGCYTSQRHVELLSESQLRLPVDHQHQFIDVAISTSTSLAYALRNDFNLYEIIIDDGKAHLSGVMHSLGYYLKLSADIPEIGFILFNNIMEHYYVISSNNIITFKTPETNITQHPIQLNDVKSVYLYENQSQSLLFACQGRNGLMVISITSDENLSILLNLYDFGDIIEVELSSDGEYLYVLNSQIGLQIYQYTVRTQKPLMLFEIPIKNPRSFSQFGNIFMVVAQSTNKMDYALEIFIDFNRLEYYFNKIYANEMSIVDVNMFEHHALLIGYDAHKIVYHGVYSQFQRNSPLTQTLIKGFPLIKVVRQKANQFIGVGQKHLKYFTAINQQPSVICYSDDLIEQTYNLQLNSSNCNTKTEKFDRSLFSLCAVKHQFTFKTIPTEQFYKNIIFQYVIIALLLTISLLLLAIYLCRRFFNYQIGYLNHKKQSHIRLQNTFKETELSLGQ